MELQVQLVDVLLKDNESLSRALSMVTRERAELCRAVSRLERSPRTPGTPQEGCARRVRVLGPRRLQAGFDLRIFWLRFCIWLHVGC